MKTSCPATCSRTDVGLWTVADDDSGLYESACWFYRVCRYTDMLVKKGNQCSLERAQPALPRVWLWWHKAILAST